METVASSSCPFFSEGFLADEVLEAVWPADRMEKRGDIEYMTPCVTLIKRRK